MVIGCCGAGKSTFSRKLHAITKLPLIHLDQAYWKAGWEETPKSTWAQKVHELAERPQWIIDGNYGGSMDIRLAKADTIIFLQYPTWLCMSRVLKRTLRHWGKTRPDMPEGCPERFDWQFLHYVLNFNRTRVPQILERLSKLKLEQQAIILKNDQEGEDLLKQFEVAFEQTLS